LVLVQSALVLVLEVVEGAVERLFLVRHTYSLFPFS
tara:strand:- start:16292 stop:16399 length:108 start_codon:yes stop_codon:yes gene_type:complete